MSPADHTNNAQSQTPQNDLTHNPSNTHLLAYFTNDNNISATSTPELNDLISEDTILDGKLREKLQTDLVKEVTHERGKEDGCISESDTENEDNGFADGDGEYYPEGGLRAWIVVFACFCGLIACFGTLNATGVVENHIQNNQLADQSSSTIGWIFSLMLFICFGSCILSGTYFDRNGFKAPMIFGSILHCGGMFALANCTKLWHFILAFSIVAGFGNGIILSPLVSAPAHYFCKRRGTATAIATAGGSIGGALIPLLLRKFFAMTRENDPNYGYVWGVRTWAFINLALLIIAIVLGKERIKKTDDIENDRSKYGEESRFKKTIRVYILQSFDAKAFSDMRFLFCVIGTVFGELSCCAAITYYSSYCGVYGISSSDSYMLIMVINLTGILGRWIPGYLSDIFGRFNVAIATLFILAIVMLVGWLPFGKDLTSMYVVSALYGFFSGSTFSLLPVCCGQISKTEEFGRRYATMYMVVSLALLAGIPITGAIIADKSTKDYSHYVIFSGVMALASCVSYIISRYFAVGMKWRRF